MPFGIRIEDDSHVISYLAVRKAIGVVGIALPFVLIAGKWVVDWLCEGCATYRNPVVENPEVPRFLELWIQPSISAYYWTSVGDVLVGGLCAIGIFLLTYQGKGQREDWAGNLACLFAVGVAFFPTSNSGIGQPALIGIAHYIFAAGLFITLAWFCLFTFQEDDIGPSDELKPYRNRIYKTCGWIILGCILALVAVAVIRRWHVDFLNGLAPVLVFETVAIVAFGVSWFVKGKGLNILRSGSAER